MGKMYKKPALDIWGEILYSYIRHIQTNVRTIFSNPEMIKEHKEDVLVPTEKACNNIVFICNAH